MTDLATELRRMAVDTGTLNCLGCGYEHKCSVRGCALLLRAAGMMEEREWISARERPPKDDQSVLIIVSGKPRRNITLKDAYEFGVYSATEGWIVEAYPEWEDPAVSYWMELPSPPLNKRH